MLRFAKSLTLIGLFVAPTISWGNETFLDTTELNCISKGIEEATGPSAAKGDTPSPKFLGLVAFGMQRSYQDTNGISGEPQRNYQRKIIEFIQANGYCIAKDDYGSIQSGDVKTPKDLALIVAGLRTREVKEGLEQSGFTRDQLKDAAKYFGLKNVDELQRLFFNGKWNKLSPEERRQHFSNATENRGDFRNGLPECLDKMSRKRQEEIFTNPEKSVAFCKTVAARCELETEFCSAKTARSTAPQLPPPGAPIPTSGNK